MQFLLQFGRKCLPWEELAGINFQKVHEDGTPESMRFPSKFWIIAMFGLGSHSLQALETSVFHQKKKKAHYFIFFHLSELKNKHFEVKDL